MQNENGSDHMNGPFYHSDKSIGVKICTWLDSRSDDLHIEELYPNYAASDTWLELCCIAYKTAISQRDINYKHYVIALSFPLPVRQQPMNTSQLIPDSTPLLEMHRKQMSTPSLYRFLAGSEPWQIPSPGFHSVDLDSLPIQLDPIECTGHAFLTELDCGDYWSSALWLVSRAEPKRD